MKVALALVCVVPALMISKVLPSLAHEDFRPLILSEGRWMLKHKPGINPFLAQENERNYGQFVKVSTIFSYNSYIILEMVKAFKCLIQFDFYSYIT